MKKNTIKAFTLVEMLIVIVIIGILIASLMPRMQSAQGRARDVARKNDLSQIQTAIITSQQDRGAFPGMENNLAKTGDSATGRSGAVNGMNVSAMSDNLQKAGMSSIPTDPNGSNLTYGLGTIKSGANATGGEYIYLVAKRNGVNNAGFVLMAKTEVEGSSNWVVCETGNNLSGGYITSGNDLKDVHTCETLTQSGRCVSNQSACTYINTSELRYILLY